MLFHNGKQRSISIEFTWMFNAFKSFADLNILIHLDKCWNVFQHTYWRDFSYRILLWVLWTSVQEKKPFGNAEFQFHENMQINYAKWIRKRNEYEKKYNDTFRSCRICRHHQLFFILKKFGLSFCENLFKKNLIFVRSKIDWGDSLTFSLK